MHNIFLNYNVLNFKFKKISYLNLHLYLNTEILMTIYSSVLIRVSISDLTSGVTCPYCSFYNLALHHKMVNRMVLCESIHSGQ